MMNSNCKDMLCFEMCQKRMVKLVLILLSLVVSSCGTYKPYDPKNPDEYNSYWNDNKNRKNSILYPLTDEYREEKEGRQY